MSATDELRRMLDERGVEWYEPTAKPNTTWFPDSFGINCRVKPWGEVLQVKRYGLTPKNAIAVTLGGGECEMDVLDTGNEAAYEHYEYIMHCANCHHEFGYVQYNEDGDTWQDEKPNYCPHFGLKVVNR